MTLIRVYVFNQQLIIPTVAQTEDGFFVDLGPVKVLTMKQLELWEPAILKSLLAGNAIIPTPAPADEPGSAILDKLNIRKWSTFETQAIMYTLHDGGRYVMLHRTGKGANGMWDNSTMEQRKFDSRTPRPLVVEALLSDIKKQPEFKPPSTGLMVLPKAEKEAKKAPLQITDQSKNKPS
jgi:hypothetical protein